MKTTLTTQKLGFAPITLTLVIETEAEALEVDRELGRTSGHALYPAFSDLHDHLALRGLLNKD